MPFISIDESPLLPGVSPIRIFYRQSGAGVPLVFLHGGWGYEVYPFDRQIEAFAGDFNIIIPDRTGYGRSTRIGAMPADFHRRAADETLRVLEALGVSRPVLWGHSDGAVIAAMIGLAAPDLPSGIILEAFHFYRVKPGSREFFETMVLNPDGLGERVCAALVRDHGEDYWREIILKNGRSWLRIAEESRDAKQDLYDGNLSALRVPAVLIHGRLDPRTEPDEMDAVRRQLSHVPIHMIEGGGHSPHSQASAVGECNAVARDFLGQVVRGGA
jgi:pimeloyl-ACP methyl ester carboxylesterase